MLQVQVTLGCELVFLCPYFHFVPYTLQKNVGSFPQFQDFIKPRCDSTASTLKLEYLPQISGLHHELSWVIIWQL